MARRLALLSLQVLINRSSSASLPHRSIFTPSAPVPAISPSRPWLARGYGRGAVSLVLSEGRPRFETIEPDSPSTREKYKTKKRLKLQRKREKRKRREACRTDPRRLRPVRKRRKDKFPSTEARIKYKIEKAKIKEAMLVEKLKKYEVPKVQGPVVKPEELTGEERFYMKKMAQKRSNYVPVGRRGVFGGVILNMHLHWKKHETVKVICKPCKPGQVHEYARDIARLSGGTPIQIIGDDTIVFYRGKNYVQPEVMSPIDTLSKKKALEKSKYEQSLETVRRFIAISEKELELYYRHVALYGDPNSRNSDLVYGDQQKNPYKLATGTTGITEGRGAHSSNEEISTDLSDAVGDSDDERRETEVDSSSEELSETAEVDYYSDEFLETDLDSENEESNVDYRLT